MTSPTIGNAVLWWVVVESPNGNHVGYFSLFDDRDTIDFAFVPSNRHLLEPIIDARAVRQLLWFSDGYFTVTSKDGKLMFSDLRFGEMRTEASQPPQYVFTWDVVLDPESGKVDITIKRPSVDNVGLVLNRLIQRAQGI
jgi:inner membrane protein